MKIKYVAFDGKEFDVLKDAENYERSLIEKEELHLFVYKNNKFNQAIIYNFISDHKTELLTILSK